MSARATHVDGASRTGYVTCTPRAHVLTPDDRDGRERPLVMVAALQLAGARPDGIQTVLRGVDGMVHGFLSRLPHLAIGLVVLLAFWIVGRLVRRAAHAAGQRTRLDPQLADVLGSLAVVLITTLGFFVGAVIVFPAFQPGDLVAGLGITSVAVGFAFKDILQNFFAGILILLRRPFHIGDQIRVRDFEGQVEAITTRSTRLKTYDGERVVIPNGDVYTSSILVRTAYDRRRVTFTVGIGYPESIEEARETIRRVVQEAEGVLPEPGPWVYVEELGASSVNFTVYFWTGSQQANTLRVRDRVATAIKQALDARGIEIPFPHTVLLFHDQTGTRPDDRAIARGDDGADGARDPRGTRRDGRRAAG